jgi:hypothetical protein
MSLAAVLLVLAGLLLLVPGGYLVARPVLPGWARPWMIWPLRSTGTRVLRLQGWAGVFIGLAWLWLAAAVVAGITPLILFSIPFLVLGLMAWVSSLVLSFRAATAPSAG